MPRPRLLIAMTFAAVLAAAGCGGADQTPSAQPAATTTAASITRARARAIALARVPGGRVTEIEQDDEDNRQVWKVKVRKGSTTRKLSIDQQTGKILKIERDTDDSDSDD
jgi:uncharacterized membrane protein YkoI